MATIKKFSVRAKMNMLDIMGIYESNADKFIEECDDKVNAIYNNCLMLRKEMKKFFGAKLKLHEAEVNMNKILINLYEENWEGRSSFENELKKMEECSKQYSDQLLNETFDELDKYISEYAPTKERIKQRKRKYAYYKNAKINLQSAEKEKKVDEQKVKQCKLDYQDAKRILDIYTLQAREDLPRFCDRRLEVFVDTCVSMYDRLKKCNNEQSHQYDAILKNLESFKEESKSGKYNLTVPLGEASSRSSLDQESIDDIESEYNSVYETNYNVISTTRHSSFLSQKSPRPSLNSIENDAELGYDTSCVNVSVSAEKHASSPMPEKKKDVESYEYSMVDDTHKQEKKRLKQSKNMNAPVPAVRRSFLKNGPQVPPKTGLEKIVQGEMSQNFVKVIHSYVASKDDELSLKIGQIVTVVDYVGDDLDEGWLYGVREDDCKKGFFPQNYTKNI